MYHVVVVVVVIAAGFTAVTVLSVYVPNDITSTPSVRPDSSPGDAFSPILCVVTERKTEIEMGWLGGWCLLFDFCGDRLGVSVIN